MQAMRLKAPGGLDQLQLTTIEARAPLAGEVQVDIKASSLNFHDYAVVVGLIPAADGRIPMSDGAGVVRAVGEGVTAFQPGDKVISHFFPHWLAGSATQAVMAGVPGDNVDGFAAQSVTMPVSCFGRMPSHLDFDAAATLPCAALTAWRALMVETHLRPGDWVLIQGSGGVSLFALQFARMMGCRVIATSSSNDKLARLESLGAEHLINYRETPEWGNRVLELTAGHGADLVVEVGGSATVAQSVRAVAYSGCISMIGVLTGISGEVPTAELFQKNARISGITVGSQMHQQDMVSAIEANQLQPVIDSHFPLEELAAAFRHQESQQHFGKICITI
ncbi:NAD(P)-dependent alcohol dehydrogenase [Parahaliea sp. F7430]|uniref:NAD(P)-dependent alcohol dehydrogenase n=1 Tax=Sediminihaliea albiluteola TaxID=2758564 RepID=A0A7W2YKR5_9GAMM|nr:NAD(P)-dependent alcohol dehydrogenase [Sediminihaliea albiluteola]MBA6414004.1 NAD(P)-dependent alcohol dehydrogenase [Sediminihaliea albiluteola]